MNGYLVFYAWYKKFKFYCQSFSISQFCQNFIERDRSGSDPAEIFCSWNWNWNLWGKFKFCWIWSSKILLIENQRKFRFSANLTFLTNNVPFLSRPRCGSSVGRASQSGATLLTWVRIPRETPSYLGIGVRKILATPSGEISHDLNVRGLGT